MSSQPDVDVVVIGSGAAGLAAALTAAQAGASVVVAEAEDEVGGSSRLSTGMMLGAGTRFQKALGIDDTPEALYREYLQLNQWEVDTGLAHRLAFDCGPAVEWVADLGVAFHDTLSFGGEESKPRNHLPVGWGADVIEHLRRESVALGVEIALRRRVDRLLVDGGLSGAGPSDGGLPGGGLSDGGLSDGGRVVGVAVGGDEITAGAVVVASGGFGASLDKLRRYFTAPTEAGDWMWYMGSAGARGDALDLADQVGAQVAGHQRGLCFLTPNFVREYEATLPGWLLMVNGDGRRFCDETVGYGILDHLVRGQGNRAFVLFDEAARQAAPAGQPAQYRQSNPSMPGRRSPNWNDETVAAMAEQGGLVRADTVAGVAAGLGLPADVVTGTVDRYNRMVAGGEDRDFRKAAEFLRPIGTAPFYGAELRPATIALTSCGVRIDPDARVLGHDGTAVPGLFAAGECTGGVLGDVYIGSGNSYSNCIVFGRAAGAGAAAWAAGQR
ncbi:MAG TPA: FAD-dependent oxidoreductase [Acidimicrobiales bacterium]|nr:FAD-dependent oxidoreductase [Acidimicrobiales bacterium]